MRNIMIALALLTAFAMPIEASAIAQARNVEYLLAFAGFSSMPEGTATVHAGGALVEMSIADAFLAAASRANDVDLGAVGQRVMPNPNYPWGIGDVWFLGLGYGPCPPADPIYDPLPGVGVHPQANVYAGGTGYMETGPVVAGQIIDWTTKDTTGGSFLRAETVRIVGRSDWWCYEFFGIFIMFPFVDGVVDVPLVALK